MTVSDVCGQVKTAMVAAAVTACTPLADPQHDFVACYGHPGKTLPDDIVSVGRVTAVIDPATLTASLRTRELTVTIEVIVSVFRAGGPEQEQPAGDQANALLNALEEYLRVTDTTLGGLLRWCFCTGHDSNGSTDPALLAKGRVIEITAQFAGKARITS